MPTDLPLAHSLAEFLEAEAITYMFGGPLALEAHGLTAGAAEIELGLDLPLAKAEAFALHMASQGVLLRERYEGPERELHLSGQQLVTGWPIRISLVGPGDRRLPEALGRRQRRALAGGTVWVYSLEDLLLEKLRQAQLTEGDPPAAVQTAARLAAVPGLNRDWVVARVAAYGLQAAWAASQTGPPAVPAKPDRPKRV